MLMTIRILMQEKQSLFLETNNSSLVETIRGTPRQDMETHICPEKRVSKNVLQCLSGILALPQFDFTERYYRTDRNSELLYFLPMEKLKH